MIDHGVVGDGRSAALIARSGAVEWLCWPRFDSSPIFAALLDVERGGSFRIAPSGPARVDRAYLPVTNVLETRFTTPPGTLVVTDLMPVGSEDDERRVLVPDHELLRIVRCERGSVDVVVDVQPCVEFGRGRPPLETHGALGARWRIGGALLTLRAETPLVARDGAVGARLTMCAGESIAFSLTFDAEAPAVLPPLGVRAREAVDRTSAWWRAWAARARYDGPYRDAVIRSTLALKLMSHAPSGAIVAAPTTSLPERLGGPLNWDYRFCWLRDASFTARVLLDLGYVEDAAAFTSWLLHATRLTRPELRVLYDVYGNAPKRERELAGIAGYAGSRPVRVGNLAFDQLQLDTYGEVIDATARLAEATGSLDRETQRLLRDFGDYVCAHWAEPDAGIWEPRNELRHRTHSRLCCWVALDRLARLADRGLLERVDVSRLRRTRDAVRTDVESHAFDERLGAYRSELGPSELDASVLLMSWYGFHPASSDRMRSTFARVRARLGAGPGLLHRYERSRADREGAFWVCSFWAVEHLALGGGTLAEASAFFEDARRYADDLGLMAEEVEPRAGEQLGNFPQAYTHVGLISAALSLASRAAEGPS